jgi:hypothetical protein
MKILKALSGILTTLLIVSFAHICLAQSATDAVKALQKLQAKVESGTNYDNYTSALGDARFEVKSFQNSPEAKKYSELAESINKTMDHYQMAADMWRRTFEGPCRVDCVEERNQVAKDYPEISSTVLKEDSMRSLWKQGVQISWKRASAELDKALTLLPKKPVKKGKGT